MKMKSIIFATLACFLVAGCSHGLSGTYLPKGGGVGNGLVMDKLDFVSGDSVDITIMSQTVRVNYKIDGKQVLLSVNGQQQVFTLDDDGCLDGGAMFGKFCKS
jgi:hypothetical protein